MKNHWQNSIFWAVCLPVCLAKRQTLGLRNGIKGKLNNFLIGRFGRESAEHERRICQRVRVVPGPVFEVADKEVTVLAQCQQIGRV